MTTNGSDLAPGGCLFSPLATDCLLRLLGVSDCTRGQGGLPAPPRSPAVCGLCHACPWYFQREVTGSVPWAGRTAGATGPLVLGRAGYSLHEYEARLYALELLRGVLGREGRCGLHEIALSTASVPGRVRRELVHAAAGTLGHGVGLLCVEEWFECLGKAGLAVEQCVAAPVCPPRSVRLLPRGVSLFGGALCGPRTTLQAAKRRVRRMRAALWRHHESLTTLLLVVRAA